MKALITGATAGIGEEFARQLAAQRHDLVLVARNSARLDSLARELRERHGVAVEVLVADLADRHQLAVVESRLARTDDPIDMLVNNAGFGVKQSFSKSSVEDEQAMIDVMVTAVMRLSHAVLPVMQQRKSGSIVVVSSVASWLSGTTYNAAKAWATVFAESLSQQAGKDIRVTALCPGFVHTEFHERAQIKVGWIPRWLWLTTDDVVRQALADMARGRVISVPGRQYKVFALLAQALPRPMVRSISARRPR